MNTLLMDNIMSSFSIDVGIDLGTSNTPLIVKNSGVKLREPSYIAMDLKKKKIIAIVYLVDQPIAAAIGAGLPIMDSRASIILDLGGGTSEISVLALGGIVVSRSSRTAGEKIDESIQAMVKRSYNLLIGDITSEEIKNQVGSAVPLDEPVEVIVKGRDLASGLPRAVKVSSDDVYEALRDNINSIIDLIKNCLECTPPELVGDILDSGIIMTGGLSQLRGLDRTLSRILKIPFRVAPDPTFCVARGIEKIFNDQQLMHMIFEKRKRRQHNGTGTESGS